MNSAISPVEQFFQYAEEHGWHIETRNGRECVINRNGAVIMSAMGDSEESNDRRFAAKLCYVKLLQEREAKEPKAKERETKEP